jgi:hypothetical protein
VVLAGRLGRPVALVADPDDGVAEAEAKEDHSVHRSRDGPLRQSSPWRYQVFPLPSGVTSCEHALAAMGKGGRAGRPAPF